MNQQVLEQLIFLRWTTSASIGMKKVTTQYHTYLWKWYVIFLPARAVRALGGHRRQNTPDYEIASPPKGARVYAGRDFRCL